MGRAAYTVDADSVWGDEMSIAIAIVIWLFAIRMIYLWISARRIYLWISARRIYLWISAKKIKNLVLSKKPENQRTLSPDWNSPMGRTRRRQLEIRGEDPSKQRKSDIAFSVIMCVLLLVGLVFLVIGLFDTTNHNEKRWENQYGKILIMKAGNRPVTIIRGGSFCVERPIRVRDSLTLRTMWIYQDEARDPRQEEIENLSNIHKEQVEGLKKQSDKLCGCFDPSKIIKEKPNE